jgi:hypothetical protein
MIRDDIRKQVPLAKRRGKEAEAYLKQNYQVFVFSFCRWF